LCAKEFAGDTPATTVRNFWAISSLVERPRLHRYPGHFLKLSGCALACSIIGKSPNSRCLIFDALPFGRLWQGELNAIGNAQFILFSWFGTPCGLAIPPAPTLRCAQAKEEEAETL
jgi:hypothetical protein